MYINSPDGTMFKEPTVQKNYAASSSILSTLYFLCDRMIYYFEQIIYQT